MVGITTRSFTHDGRAFNVTDDEIQKVLKVTDQGGAVMRINYKGGFQVISFRGADGGEAPPEAIERLVRVQISGVLGDTMRGGIYRWTDD